MYQDNRIKLKGRITIFEASAVLHVHLKHNFILYRVSMNKLYFDFVFEYPYTAAHFLSRKKGIKLNLSSHVSCFERLSLK